MNEGLAELYQTFEIANGGRTALIGKPSRDNLVLLQASSQLMPVSDLIAVRNDSPLYNEGDRRGLFYAESWALVHYLTFGAPARSVQLRAYLTAIGRGDRPDEAFSNAFGVDTRALDVELRQYIRSYQFRALRVEFDERVSSGRLTPAQLLADDDAAGYLGDLLARSERVDDARALLQKTITANPEAGRALSALGTLELRAGNDDGAFVLLEKGASLLPGDAAIQSAYGRALTRQANRGVGGEDELYRRARIVLARALEIEPDNASTMVTLAEVEMASGANPPKAVELMQRVVKAAPAREDYRLMLGQAMAVNGDYRGANAYLGAIVARGSTEEIRDAARRALARVAAAENAARALAASSNRASTPEEPPRPTADQGVFIPNLRPVKPGESRVLGTFASVDCVPGAIVLQVDRPEGAVRMAIKSFDEVEFLTYRQDSPSSVACGAQTPAYRVLATFRTDIPVDGANTPNRAVAIELLPDGYAPQ
ncbi:MAG: tetratricopeptide repeat protein [Vicinamibacterales bacterium]